MKHDYKEYDENDMIYLLERTENDNTNHCKITFDIDYEYGMVSWNYNYFDMGYVYKISNVSSKSFVFEYDANFYASLRDVKELSDKLIWRI